MKRVLLTVTVLFFLFLSVGSAESSLNPGERIFVEPYSSKVVPEEKEFVSGWFPFLNKEKAAGQKRYSTAIPFSFVVGDRSSREWVKWENATVVTGEWTGNVRKHTLSWKDSKTALACEMILSEYREEPAMEWVVRLKNEGKTDSPKVHDFKVLDYRWNSRDKGPIPRLHRSIGGPAAEIDFRFLEEEMRQSLWSNRRTIRMDASRNATLFQAYNNVSIPNDSRPSAHWLPFFNYQTGNDGIIIGLGWNGRWFTEFDHKGNGQTDITAGMEFLDTKLHPGESIRSPLVLLLYWQGEVMHAQNMFRQFVLLHHVPQENGRPIVAPISCITWGGWPSSKHIAIIQKLAEKKIPFDVYWIDAGWYGTGVVPSASVFQGDWGPMAGDWRVNRNWHPDTLRPVSEAANAAGMKFLLWVEPERAIQGRPITLEHPEYFCSRDKKSAKGNTLLLNLGKEESLKWAVDTVDNLIKQNKIDWYREDFNLDPGSWWDATDEPDRKGISEIRFVENLYRLWDSLKEKNPQLKIDNCASGGRRFELETMLRSLSFCRSDYNCFTAASLEAIQDHSFAISCWIPLEGCFTISRDDIADTYEMRSCLSAGLSIRPISADNTESQWNLLRRHIVEAQRARDYFYGDYYPLANAYDSQSSWSVRQFYLPKEQRGMIVALRRPQSDVSSMKFDLKPIPDDESKWEFENADTGEKVICTGCQIRKDGWEIKIPQRRGSAIIWYCRR